MLLLQLKHGIEITSPTDPRIDSVKDEDFDECFVPIGGLKLEEADARMVEEGKRRQKELCEAQKRLERLRACERIWEKEKRKMKEEKMRVVKKREEEARLAEAKRVEKAEALRQRPRVQFAKVRIFKPITARAYLTGSSCRPSSIIKILAPQLDRMTSDHSSMPLCNPQVSRLREERWSRPGRKR